MRSTKTTALLFAVAVMLILSATSRISGFQNLGIGEYVNVAPLKHASWQTPPGHYGLMASYANSYLSKALSNGNYQVTWDFVDLHLEDYFVLDIRSNSAYCSSHIIGAVNIPYATVAEPYNLDKLPTDQPILIVCGSGMLSSQIAPILGMMGYQVRILSNGMNSVPSEHKEACK